MGDHLDFSGSVFNEPFVAKSVVHSSQVTSVHVTRPDDKVYVVLRTDYFYDGESTNVVGVAMYKDAANDFVRTYSVPQSTLIAHEQGTEGLWYRHFDVNAPGDIEMVALYVEVTNVI